MQFLPLWSLLEDRKVNKMRQLANSINQRTSRTKHITTKPEYLTTRKQASIRIESSSNSKQEETRVAWSVSVARKPGLKNPWHNLSGVGLIAIGEHLQESSLQL